MEDHLLNEAREILIYRKELINHQLDIEHDKLARTHEKLLDAILNSKMCKKCKASYETKTGHIVSSHHPPIIVKSDKKDEFEFLDNDRPIKRCRYVLYQYWLDFLVKNRTLIESNPPMKAQLKIVLLSLRDNECCTPPFDWHYFQIFRETLNAPININKSTSSMSSTTTTKKTTTITKAENQHHGMKIYEFCRDLQHCEDQLKEQMVKRQNDNDMFSEVRSTYTWSTNPLLELDEFNDISSEETEERDFIEFMENFLLSEYGEASDVHQLPITMSTHINDDLYLDELARCVLYAWMDDKYFFKNRYRTLSLKEFDAAKTLGDLYNLTTTK